MNSKECLNKIQHYINGTEITGKELLKCYETIYKGLERLEKLEKAFEVLKKSLLLSVVEIREHYYVCAHDNNYFMRKEEADLIKEVIEND